MFDPDRKDHHWGKRKLKRDQMTMAATMSALTPKADIGRPDGHVRLVPKADMATGLFNHLVGASKNARRDDRILITKFVFDRRFAGGSPRLVTSIICPLPDRQLHIYPASRPGPATRAIVATTGISQSPEGNLAGSTWLRPWTSAPLQCAAVDRGTPGLIWFCTIRGSRLRRLPASTLDRYSRADAHGC